MSLKLEEMPFDLNGRTYLLRCNMAVLETVQDAHGGDFASVTEMPVKDSALEFLSAMLNDYAQEQGWPDTWTPTQLKRKVTLSMLTQIFGLVTRSLTPPKSAAAPAAASAAPDAGN